MNQPSSQAEGDLREQRRAILRGLSLINSFNFAVVILVTALASVAVVLGLKARDDAEKLWAASVTQARASRFGGEIGWKNNALATIAAASQVRPSLALRNEAISGLATLDLEPISPWHQPDQALRAGDVMAFSPDLKRVAIGGAAKMVQVLEAASGKVISELKCPPYVQAVAFNANGNYLAARSYEGHLRVWEVGSGASGAEVIAAALGEKGARTPGIEFSGDSVITSPGGGRIDFYSLKSGSKSRTLETGGDFEGFAVDPGGRFLGLFKGREVQFWDLETGLKQKALQMPGFVSSVAVSPEGKYVAAGSVDTHIYLWNVATGEVRTFSGHQGLVYRITFNSAGTQLASCAYGGTAKLWEVDSGLALLGTETMFIDRFSQDGQSVACTRVQSGFGIFRISDAGVFRSAALPGAHEPAIVSGEFLDDESLLVVRSDGAQIVDIASGTVRGSTQSKRTRGAAWNPLMNVLVTSSGEGLQLWPALDTMHANPKPIRFGPPESIPLKQGRPDETLKLSADGSEAVLRIGLRGAVLFDLQTREVKAAFNVPNIGGVAISPGKQWIATGTFHGSGTKVWDRNGKLVKDIEGRDGSVAFSPDGRWLAIGSAEACEVYKTGDWTRLYRVETESASGLPAALTFSQDSKMIAFGQQRRAIKLIATETGTELATLTPPYAQQINVLAFSPSGEQLVAGTSDSMLQIWHLGNLRAKLAALQLHWGRGREGGDLGATATANPMMNWVAGVAGATLFAVVLFGILAWVRHRQFVSAYVRIEQLIDARDRQLAAAQDELHQSQKMRALGTLAAGIAHDFNNLLSVIRLSNQLTAEQTQDNADVQENISVVEKAINQGRHVVRSMLGYSRKAGDPERFAVPAVVEGTLGLLRQQFLREIQLELQVAEAVPPVIGVKNRLEQIVLNLSVNAAEAMQGKGKLRIIVREAAARPERFILHPREARAYVEIVISDSGPGIAEEIRDRVFEPFFTTKMVGNERGTGLGLSIVYAMSQEEGIGVALEQGEQAGTTFRLLIPAESALAVAAPRREMEVVSA